MADHLTSECINSSLVSSPCGQNVTDGHLNWTNPDALPVPRFTLISSYLTVFLLCFLGNCVLLYVITVNSRMRTRTNLFLANLAVADLCVGLFCVLPRLHRMLYQQWFLGQALCKIHIFMENMNLAASMLLLEMMAVERYIAINYPLRTKRFFTQYKLYIAQCVVWLVASLYSCPYLFLYNIESAHHENVTVNFCVYERRLRSSMQIYYLCTFIVWYLLPITLLSVLYTRIALTLWRSGLSGHMTTLRRRIGSLASSNVSEEIPELSSLSSGQSGSRRPFSVSSIHSNIIDSADVQDVSPVDPRDSGPRDSAEDIEMTSSSSPRASWRQHPRLSSPQDLTKKRIYNGRNKHGHESRHIQYSARLSRSCSSGSSERTSTEEAEGSAQDRKSGFRRQDRARAATNPSERSGARSRISSGTNVCRYRVISQKASRRRVIVLLLAVLITFAVLTLPFHIKRLRSTFDMDISDYTFLSIVCPLLTYLNSAMNPILYCLLSQSFRRSLRESMSCLFKLWRKQPWRAPVPKTDITSAITSKRTLY